MPDVIAPADRALIDAALAAGRAAADARPRPGPKPRAADLERVRDRRRFKSSAVPTGAPARIAPAELVGTIFPSRVFDVGDARVLKDGASNAKIGGDVLVGRLRGARILTLTLEERATCPASCPLWRGCYGNAMQFARRWRHGPALEAALTREVAEACAGGRRVHVLGDFYSTGYVGLWLRLLQRHPRLHVFGFTAWGPESEIGAQVAGIRRMHPQRFAVRHSGRCITWGSFTIDFPTERKEIGDAIVCPEQRAAMAGDASRRHCGSCGVCWSTDRPIVFVEH